MDGFILPAQIHIVPYVQPCREVSDYVNDEGKNILRWIPGKKDIMLPGEIEEFIKDANKLIISLGLRCLKLTIGDFSSEKHNESINAIKYFWKKWGPLFPTPKKHKNTREKEIGIYDLYTSCWGAMFAIGFWEINENLPSGVIEDFFNFVRIYISEGNAQPKYWYISSLPYKQSAKAVPWFPLLKPMKVSNDSFDLNISHPKKELLLDSCPRELRVEWVRQSVMQSVVNYIDRQNIQLRAKVKGGDITFAAITENLFLTYLMKTIKKVTLCPCGCGGIVPPRRKYAKPGCKERMPKRRFDDWIGKLKKREKITPEEHDNFQKEGHMLLKSGYSYDEIRKRIEKKMGKEVLTHGQGIHREAPERNPPNRF